MVKNTTLKNSYIFEILGAIAEKPRRYTDLAMVCPNETTRSRRMKELKTEGLINANVMAVGKKNAIFYKLTSKGQKLLSWYSELRKL